jgi:signal transduction histidine kinase
VRLSLDREYLELDVIDNGLGFDATSESDGNGLLSMRRRALGADGKLDIESTAGNGTKVSVRLPSSTSPVSLVRKK